MQNSLFDSLAGKKTTKAVLITDLRRKKIEKKKVEKEMRRPMMLVYVYITWRMRFP